MYYTSSGAGNAQSSAFSGQDDSHQYYGRGDSSEYEEESSSRHGNSGMDYGHSAQSSYSANMYWGDSSLASAHRSLQSWKSVGFSATASGKERPPGMEPRADKTSFSHERPFGMDQSVDRGHRGPGAASFDEERPPNRGPVSRWAHPAGGEEGPHIMEPPAGKGSIPRWIQPLAPGAKGGTPSKPLPSGVQTFQPKGGMQSSRAPRSGIAVPPAARASPAGPSSGAQPAMRASPPTGSRPGMRARPPGPPRPMRPAFTSGSSGQEQYPAINRATSSSQQVRFGSGPSAQSARGAAPPNMARAQRPTQTRHPPPPWLPTSSSRMTTAASAVRTSDPVNDVTPFQSRLQEFSTKTCDDLGITVQQQLHEQQRRPGAKNLCSLEGFSTKATIAPQNVEDVITSETNKDDEEDEDDDDDDDVDMTQCTLCNIKFEKEQVISPPFS